MAISTIFQYTVQYRFERSICQTHVDFAFALSRQLFYKIAKDILGFTTENCQFQVPSCKTGFEIRQTTVYGVFVNWKLVEDVCIIEKYW